MQDKDLGKKIFSGMKWKAIERIFLQLINAVTPMVLARILLPEDFGIIAILTVFVSLANTFVNNGLGNSIIQKKDSDDLDCSTVFYTQFIIAVICYAVLFVCSPFIASLYGNEELSLMLRVMSLTIVIGSLGSIQITVMKKNMDFQKSFVIYGSATIAYGIVGIGLAYAGYGSWSLVWAGIANSVVLQLAAMLMIKWKPLWQFSFFRLKSLFSYSWKLTVGWLIGTLHQDLYVLVIGKRFSSATLGYYNRAGSFPQIITKTVTEVVDGVMFPAMSQMQDDRDKLRTITKTLLSMNSYILFPIFMGLASVAENLVKLILTEKWLPSVPMMQIMCITYALNSINNSNMQVFNSMGRSDIFMKFELIKRSISMVLLVAMSFVSIYAVIIVLLVMAILSNMMNAYQNNKLLGIGYAQQLKCLLPAFLCSVVMYGAVAVVSILSVKPHIALMLQIIIGVATYLITSYIFKLESFLYLLKYIKTFKCQKKSLEA